MFSFSLIVSPSFGLFVYMFVLVINVAFYVCAFISIVIVLLFSDDYVARIVCMTKMFTSLFL